MEERITSGFPVPLGAGKPHPVRRRAWTPALRQLLRRLASFLLTMLLVSFLTFLAFALVPGDPAQTKLGIEATPERLEVLRQQWGLDRPLLLRYAAWVAGFFTGDLGISYHYDEPVWTLVAPKLGVTLCLCLISFALIVLISIPLGALSYRIAGGPLSPLQTAINQFCMAVPPFFTGILVSWGFGITLKLFVPGDLPELAEDPLGAVRHLFFAAICIAIPRIAMTVRMMRSTVAGELRKSYVRTAISRGSDRRTVLRTHVLKNSLVPTVTFLGQAMAEIIGGSVVVEQVFGIPGLGRFLVASIGYRDYPVVETIVVILAFWVVLAGTLADLINQAVDPRLRLGVRK